MPAPESKRPTDARRDERRDDGDEREAEDPHRAHAIRARRRPATPTTRPPAPAATSRSAAAASIALRPPSEATDESVSVPIGRPRRLPSRGTATIVGAGAVCFVLRSPDARDAASGFGAAAGRAEAAAGACVAVVTVAVELWRRRRLRGRGARRRSALRPSFWRPPGVHPPAASSPASSALSRVRRASESTPRSRRLVSPGPRASLPSPAPPRSAAMPRCAARPVDRRAVGTDPAQAGPVSAATSAAAHAATSVAPRRFVFRRDDVPVGIRPSLFR